MTSTHEQWEADEDRFSRTPEREERPDEEPRREQEEQTHAGVVLLAAFRAAFHASVVMLDEMTLRTIGNSYASMLFAYGPERHPAGIVALRVAMDAYVAVCPETESLLFPEGCPF